MNLNKLNPFNWFKKQNWPKESIRSLMIEGVIKVTTTNVEWDTVKYEVIAPFPLVMRHEDGQLCLTYPDGSSKTLIDKDSGDLIRA